LDREDAVERLLAGIADGFNIAHPARLAFAAMLKELRDAAADSAPSSAEPAHPITPEPELPPDQVKILRVLGFILDQGIPEAKLASLPDEARVKPSAFTHHIDELERRRFVHIDYLTHGAHEVRLMPAGSKWLLDHEDILGV
jgi:hypothetical protein